MNPYTSDYTEHDSSPMATQTLKFFRELEDAAEEDSTEETDDA